MYWAGVSIGVALIAWGAYLGVFPRTWRDERWRRADAESESRGYRISIAGFWLWVDSSRLRSALVALTFVMLGLFMIGLAWAGN